ncbi:hypothetical protein [Actinomadura keratinilytica]|uniref:hypothetical protein n=1 Tax=Actinomadura keratinilytica TaxID=547461 RepID=UPI00361D87DE
MTGVSMAGFRDRGRAPGGHRAIPHPGVTLAVEFGAAPLIVDAAGRRLRGSVVAGLGFGPGELRVRGEYFEAVQVRLSPLVARAVLGVSPPTWTAPWWRSTTCGAGRRHVSASG